MAGGKIDIQDVGEYTRLTEMIIANAYTCFGLKDKDRRPLI